MVEGAGSGDKQILEDAERVNLVKEYLNKGNIKSQSPWGQEQLGLGC